jgi:hypothetical protein
VRIAKPTFLTNLLCSTLSNASLPTIFGARSHRCQGALKMTTPALWSSILTGIEQTGTISDDEFAAIREELA